MSLNYKIYYTRRNYLSHTHSDEKERRKFHREARRHAEAMSLKARLVMVAGEGETPLLFRPI